MQGVSARHEWHYDATPAGTTMAQMAVAELRERAAELTQLSAVLAAAGRGRGQVCVVEGPSGVGKSRLLDECGAFAEASGMRILRARCSELTRDYSFGIARNLFESTVIRADSEMRGVLMQGPAALAEPVFGHGEASDVFGVIHWSVLADGQPRGATAASNRPDLYQPGETHAGPRRQ